MEHAAGDLVHARVELVHSGGDDGADGAADDLPVELCFGGGAEQVAGFEVLHHVAGLEGGGFGDGAGEEVDCYGVGVGGWGDKEGEEELG